jgi:hypothetical protein
MDKNSSSQPDQNLAMQKAIDDWNQSRIITLLPTYKGNPLPFELAMRLIYEGGGYPVTILDNLDKFINVNINVLAEHLIKTLNTWALLGKWPTLPAEFDKKKAVEVLLAHRAIPTDEKRFRMIASDTDGIHTLISKLSLSYLVQDRDFMDVVGYASEGGLDEQVAQALITANLAKEALKVKGKFNPEAQKRLEDANK